MVGVPVDPYREQLSRLAQFGRDLSKRLPAKQLRDEFTLEEPP
jgi:hypothetical protein